MTVPAIAQGKSGFHTLSGAAARGFEVPADSRQSSSMNLPRYGLRAERYQQYLGDAAVLGGQLTVFRDAQSQTVAVIGSHFPDIVLTNAVRLNQGQARAVAAQDIGEAGNWILTLMIDPASGRYFYRVENQRFDSRWFYWIDAEFGNVLNAYDGLTTGSGVGVDGGVKDLSGLTTHQGGAYALRSSDGRQTTYDARNRNRLPGTLATDSDDNWITPGTKSPGQPALVDAQFFAAVTDGYLLGTHSFDWKDYYSQGMVSSAHVGRRYNNAYWNGSQMAYGDGDGSTFYELSGDLDVVAHELTHGVTDATSDLIYQNESGALNEAFSDIMGTAVEFHHRTGNWTIGEDIDVRGNGFRNMADPGEDGDPSHYDERYTGTSDNGGVHINSGIANHWFYLLVNGGQNADANYASGTNVQGIGMAIAEQIAFLGFTALTSNATFCNARASTIAVAGNDFANVGDAWDEVGVNDSFCNGGSSGGGSGGAGGGDDETGPVIENVNSRAVNTKNGRFEITWATDEPATSVVTFTCCGTFDDSSLVTNHKMGFRGTKGQTYTFNVTSVDASGNSTTAGPFTHKN
jgi:thermolysin